MRLDRIVTVFRLEKTKNGFVRHDVYKDIKANFRQLSDQERVSTFENGTNSTCQFRINARKITLDMYVEYKREVYGKTIYQVTSVDDYNEHQPTIVVRCSEIQHALTYKEE